MPFNSRSDLAVRLASGLAAVLFSVGILPATAQEHPRQEVLDQLHAATNLNDLLRIHAENDFPRGNLLLSDNDFVGDHDFYVLSEHFGSTSSGYAEGDLNLDGVTDLADLAIMSFNSGHSRYAADPVPASNPANLGLGLNANRSVVVSSSRPVHLGALEFESPGGGLSLPSGATERREPFSVGGQLHTPPSNLTQASAAMPGFHWVLSDEPDSIVLATEVGWSVTLDGDLTTVVHAATDDVSVRWFEANDLQVHSRQLGDGDAVTGRVEPPVFGPIIKPSQRPFRVGKPGVPDDLFFATDETSLIAFHQELDIPRGDLDGDAKVLFSDFLTLSAFFGQEVAGYEQGDLNLDGVVSLADYAILSNNWNATEFIPDPPSVLPQANLGLWLGGEGQILISSRDAVQIGGLAIESPSGSIELSPIRQQGPASLPGTFQFELTPPDAVAEQFVWAAIPGNTTEIHGTLVTHVTDATDIQLSWFELGSNQLFTRRLGEGDPPNDQLSGFEPYPDCSDPDRDPASTCVSTEIPPVEPPRTFELLQLDGAADLEELLRLHDDLNIARGDINGNGYVEFTDLLQFLPGYGGEADEYSDGDLDLNGVVDFEDLAILGTHYATDGFAPSLPPVERQNVFIYFDDEGSLVFGVDEVLTIGGIELTSASGGLLPAGDVNALHFDGPFVHSASNDSESIVWFTPGSSQFAGGRGGEVLAEDLVTEIKIRPGTDDLQFRYYLFDSFEVFTGEVELPDFLDLIMGDLNGDGAVDFTDFLTLSGNFGNEGDYADGDIDGDGIVQFEDFLIMAGNFDKEDAVVSVPEPGGILVWIWMPAIFALRRHAPRR